MNFITTNRDSLFLRLNTTCEEVIAAKASAGIVLIRRRKHSSVPVKEWNPLRESGIENS
jgi:hypothetical protein